MPDQQRDVGGNLPPHARMLSTKNTFLDCASPWLDPLELPRRPTSDPTSSTSSMSHSDSATGSSAHTSEGTSEAGDSRAAGTRAYGSPDWEGYHRRLTAAAIARRIRGQGGATASGAPVEEGAEASGAEPAGREQEGELQGDENERITKTQRRRFQKKVAKAWKAQDQGADGPEGAGLAGECSSETAPASSGERGPAASNRRGRAARSRHGKERREAEKAEAEAKARACAQAGIEMVNASQSIKVSL